MFFNWNARVFNFFLKKTGELLLIIELIIVIFLPVNLKTKIGFLDFAIINQVFKYQIVNTVITLLFIISFFLIGQNIIKKFRNLRVSEVRTVLNAFYIVNNNIEEKNKSKT